MSGRPSELELALDAFDEAFKQAVTHLASLDGDEKRAAYTRAQRARESAILVAKELSR